VCVIVCVESVLKMITIQYYQMVAVQTRRDDVHVQLAVQLKTAMQNCAVHVMLRSFKQKSNILFRGGSSLSSGVCIKTGGRGAEEGQSLVYKNSVSVCDWCIIRAADTVTRLFFNVNTANAK